MIKKTIQTQWGSEATPFREYTDIELSNYLLSLKDFVHKIYKVTGYEVFVTYGTLLGGVRSGNIIANDFDFDLSIVIQSPKDKYDLIRNFKLAIAKIKELDGIISITTGSACHYAICYQVDAIAFTVDIFLSWFENQNFFHSFSIDSRFEIEHKHIFPLSSVKLMGVSFPAPNNSELLLECIYGDSWKIPDPTFTYRNYFDSLGGEFPYEFTVFGRLKYNFEYWDNFYKQNATSFLPSQFAVFANNFIVPSSKILELGSGNGRDTYYLARSGHFITATDFSNNALRTINSNARDSKLKNIETLNIDYADYIEVDRFCLNNPNSYDVVYARFLFHAVSEAVEQNLLELASRILKDGGLLLTEFRAEGDGIYDKQYPWKELELTGNHYRRPINPHDFQLLLTEYNFSVTYHTLGKGYAYHASDDPTVCRIAATKSN